MKKAIGTLMLLLSSVAVLQPGIAAAKDRDDDVRRSGYYDNGAYSQYRRDDHEYRERMERERRERERREHERRERHKHNSYYNHGYDRYYDWDRR